MPEEVRSGRVDSAWLRGSVRGGDQSLIWGAEMQVCAAGQYCPVVRHIDAPPTPPPTPTQGQATLAQVPFPTLSSYVTVYSK